MIINDLIIYSKNLPAQIDFYANRIGLPILDESATQVQFTIGHSILKIIQSDKHLPYHFAINIPSNQDNEALVWLKERVEILKDGEYEIQDFDFWNAKAIYFYDNDNNIVEFIARKNRQVNSHEKFSIDSLQSISEIGVPVNNIESTYKDIHQICQLEVFDGSFERFCAIGDEEGLFICINKQVKDWFPTNDKAHSAPFTLKFEKKGKKYLIRFENEKITNV